MSKSNTTNTQNILVDPAVTTIAQLLDLAGQTPSGIITIKGERPDDSVEWGVAVMMGPVAGEAIDIIDNWAEAVVNEATDPTIPELAPFIEPN